MSEKSQIVFMQARLIRLAAKKWNTDIQKASSLLSQYGLFKADRGWFLKLFIQKEIRRYFMTWRQY